MQRFPMAHSDGEDWRMLCSACLEQFGRSDSHSSLGFLYVTTSLARHLGDILALLKQATGIAHWIGSQGGLESACANRCPISARRRPRLRHSCFSSGLRMGRVSVPDQ